MKKPVAEIIPKDLSYGRYLLKNNTDAPFSDNFTLEWFLELSGYVIDKGILDIDCDPLGEKPFGFSHELPEKGLCTVLFSVVSKKDTEAAPRESEFAFAQFVLREEEPLADLEEGTLPMKAEQTESLYAVHSPFYALAFAKKSLLPLTLICDGKTVLSSPARWNCTEPVTLHRTALRRGTALARLNGLWVEGETEAPVSAGSLDWTINGDGKLLLHILPVRTDGKVSLTFPILNEFDYVELFAQIPCTGCDGIQKSTVLSRDGDVSRAENTRYTGLREISLSSGITTVSFRTEHPAEVLFKDGITLIFDSENKLLISLENEHM